LRPETKDIADAVESGMGCKEAARHLRDIGFRFRNSWFSGAYAAIPPIAGGRISPPEADRKTIEGKCFVFTSQQNNTYIHRDFFDSLQQLVKHRGAQLVVSRFSYNKFGWATPSGEEPEETWYDHTLEAFWQDESVQVAPDLVFCGELNILPTAAKPLTGMDSYTKQASSIIPHAKVQLRSVPTMKHDPPKFLYTTGAVTQRNYIQKKSGQIANHHHIFGALLVEVDDSGDWFARQLVASDDGTFYDLDVKYSPTGWETDQPVEAMNWGDIHLEKIDDAASQSAWGGPGSIIDTLKPKHQFIHDVTDFQARNHHNIDDPHFLAEMYALKRDSVEDEIILVREFLLSITRPGMRTIIVESNHDQALGIWLKNTSAAKDPANARFWHKLNFEMHQAVYEDRKVAPFAEAVGELGGIEWLPEDESFVICSESGGIECGVHGHRGANGSRGNPQGYRRVGTRMNTGHTHSAEIIDGVYVAGVLGSLDMGYNTGMSSWSHSSIVTYASGKRAIITMRGGSPRKWRSRTRW
jgi:hypothetical protein